MSGRTSDSNLFAELGTRIEGGFRVSETLCPSGLTIVDASPSPLLNSRRVPERGAPAPIERFPASAKTGGYESSGSGDVPWGSGDGACAAPGLSGITKVASGWTLSTLWLTEVSATSNRSASPASAIPVRSLSLGLEAGGNTGWPLFSASTSMPWPNTD